jgi:hypothetical protein
VKLSPVIVGIGKLKVKTTTDLTKQQIVPAAIAPKKTSAYNWCLSKKESRVMSEEEGAKVVII